MRCFNFIVRNKKALSERLFMGGVNSALRFKIHTNFFHRIFFQLSNAFC